MSRLNVWPWLRPFIILVLVVSLPPLLYWFGYVQHSVQAAKQQAYVTLSAVATNFRDRLAAHDQIAANAEKMSAARMSVTAEARLKAYLESVLQPKGTMRVTKATWHLQIGETSGGLYLNVGAFECGEGRCAMRAVLPLEDLIPWNVVQTEFDGLLILSKDGRLLAQDRRLPKQPLGVVVPLQTAAPQAQSSTAGKEGGPPKIVARERSLRSPIDFSDLESIELAGTEYIAFTQPVLIVVTPVGVSQSADAAAGKPETLQFTVCGLVAKDRLRREALELSPQTLIFIGSMVAFGLFAIPFLKLRFIGARERMHPRDIWLLASSLLCATALMVLVILDALTLSRLRDRFDAGLSQFSQSVQKNMRTEAGEAVAQLRAVAPDLLKPMPPAIEVKGVPQLACQDRPDTAAAGLTPQFPVGSVLASTYNFPYPDFEAVFATNLCGKQVRKWMPRTIPTGSVDIHESYFPDTMTMTAKASPQVRFIYSSVIAQTSGLPLAVYAMPFDARTLEPGPDVAAANRSGIIAIATPMRSANFPVVPEPYQFVLVNRQGEVTFQQAQGPFRGERFFDSVQGGAALERAARTTPHQKFPDDYRFRGRTYRMRAIDMPDLQVTLVAYYDRAVVSALAARVFGATALFVLGIIASMLIGAVLAVCWFGKAALDWAWPTPSRAVLYLLGSGACLCSMAVLLLVRSIPWPHLHLWFILAAPALIMIVLGSGRVIGWMQRLAVKLHLDNTAVQKSRRLTALAFQSFAVMAMLAFVAWPTVIVYNDAFTLQASAFTASVARNWSIARTKWQDRVHGPVANVGDPLPLPPQACTVVTDLRCAVPDRIYATRSNYDALIKVRNAKGVYNNCINLLAADDGCDLDGKPDSVPGSFTVGAASGLARFGRSNVDLAQTLSWFSNEQGHARHVPLLEGIEWSRWSLGGFSLLIAALSLLVGSVSKHVLGLGLSSDVVLDEQNQFERKDGTRWLLLRPSSSALAAVAGPATTHVDLRDMQLTAQFTPPAAGTILCVHHLDRRLSDQKWRDALLLLLSTDTPGCVVMTSEIDPLYYLTQRSREKEDYLRSMGSDDSDRRKAAEDDSRDLRNELAHWGVALRDARKIRQTPAVFPDIPVAAARLQLRNKLVDECAHNEPLIEIGARLLRRPDLESYCWGEIVGFILDAAEPYYRSMWELCSREERLVLIQLAQEGLVNPRRVELVRRLARRGLVLFDPRLRMMNESFHRFVRTVEAPERIAEWERTTEGMSWSRLGTPLYALAAVIIAILLFTEQAMFTGVLAIATGAAGTLGSLRNLYTAAVKPVLAPVKLA